MRSQDLAVAEDIRALGGKVMVIGPNIPEESGDLVLPLPAAEYLSQFRGVDCDSFRVSSYIVDNENGLLAGRSRK